MLHHSDVEKTISYVAKSLSAMMDAEIMILDDKGRVISGTASSEKGYHLSHIYKHIIQNPELVVVNNPGFNDLCIGCSSYGNCNELIELAAPILVKNQCIGIISITCYEEKQRRRILEKTNSYTDFLLQMCSLLASRAEEVKTKEALRVTNAELSTIINSVDNCIVALNKDDCVTFCNRFTELLLSAPESKIVNNPISLFCPTFRYEREAIIDTKQEIEIVDYYGKRQIAYMSAHPISSDNEVTGTILIIEEISKVNRFVSGFIGTNNILSSSDIISVGKPLQKVKMRAKKVSSTDSTVLIRGESGTGKEMFARAIHDMSTRSSGPFIALNCAAIPDSLLESELFGYESGAFTGAKKGGKPGYFELADTGTIFLDEVGDMPLYLQGKLLRVLQEKKVQRVGGEKEKKIDIRIIAATNKNLEEMVSDSSFREDLFYRLNVIPLTIPPLRERGNADILALIKYFMNKYGQHFDKPISHISNEATEVLTSYSWPGNVRELENAVEYMLNMETSSTIKFDSLPEHIRVNNDKLERTASSSLKAQLSTKEKELIREVLSHHEKSKKGRKEAADVLDISIASLYRKIREYKLD